MHPYFLWSTGNIKVQKEIAPKIEHIAGVKIILEIMFELIGNIWITRIACIIYYKLNKQKLALGVSQGLTLGPLISQHIKII